MKKYWGMLSILVVLVLLQGCYAPQQSQPTPFTVDIKVDKPVYRIGEDIVISVRASRGCYLTLYDISTKGEVTQIFPNRFASDNLIQGGQLYRIPSEADQFDFEITGPPGIERVRAVGTMDNVNLFDMSRSAQDEVFPRIYVAPGRFEQSLDQKLGTMPNDQWAEASVTFEVR